MFVNERGNIEILPQLTYSSEISTFMFWEIEKVIFPKRKLIIRLKK
jgi:hypothetical protein